MRFKTGIGIDAHRLIAGRPLVLGGVRIDHPRGLEGHSDADVLSHAIADSLLGAAGMEDIGHYFPDTDPAWKDSSSLEILTKIREMVEKNGCEIGNVDAVVVAEAPRISEHRQQMKENLAKALGIAPASVTVRGTTTEAMGFTGRREGIAAFAVCLLECGGRITEIDL